MTTYTPLPLRTAVALLSLGMGASAIAQNESDRENITTKDKPTVEYVHVYGEQGKTTTATKLNLTIFETPQTVTAISRAQMDDFALHTIGEVLDYTPGVTVEEVETDRTYYTARGFDIVNFQYDGVGAPFTYGINLGQQDTAIYEKIEVVKGAAGLITGLANPSATVNYIRKRPTKDLQIGAGLSLNEWNGVRVDGDISGALSEKLRGRFVVATDQGDSYLDRYEKNSDLAYGILEFDLTDSTLLTVGHSYNKSANNGTLWGALPLVYSDGSQTDYDASTSTAPDWTYSDTTQNQTFIELQQQLNERWTLSAIFTRNQTDLDSQSFYVYGIPDRDTEVGLLGYASAYISEDEQRVYDLFVTGSVDLFGREHQLVVGYNHADIANIEASYFDSANGYPTLGSDWAAGNTPRPNLVEGDPINSASDIKQTQKSLYFSTRFSLTDRLSALLGARRAEISQKGSSYGGPANTDASKTVPYYGVTYLLTENTSLYASYSEVFTQQTWVDSDLKPLGATEGESTELGLKKSFNNERAILTLAYFQSEHNNLGVFVGRNSVGTGLYEPRYFDTDGVEVELSGELAEGFNVGIGVTKLRIEDQDGEKTRVQVPTKLLKASASYRLPAWPKLKVGGVIKWQNDVRTENRLAEQEDYALLDLALRYDITPKVGLSLNIDNVTDEKYLNSLYWEQAYYGAPRNVGVSISWQY